MKKILCLIFALITMILNGCGKTETPGAGKVTTTTTTTTTTAATTTTTSNESAVETTYITVTGEDGAAVTDADGAAVTSAIAVDPTTTTTTDAVTTADTTTTTTTTTAKPVVNTTKAPVVQTTTTSTTTVATTTTTTAPVDDGNPWTWPCDWQRMEADCKAYVESKGWHWDENLNVDRGSWAGNEHTYNQKYRDQFEEVKGLIDLKNFISGDTYFKCVFIPDEEADGHYYIYIVHGSGPTPADMPESSLNADFTDLAKQAVN